MTVLHSVVIWRKRRGVRTRKCPVIRCFGGLFTVFIYLPILTSIELASSAESHLTESIKNGGDEAELQSTWGGSKSRRDDTITFTDGTYRHFRSMIEGIGRKIDAEDRDGSLSNLINDISLVFGTKQSQDTEGIKQQEQSTDNVHKVGTEKGHEVKQQEQEQQQQQTVSAKGGTSDQEEGNSDEQEEYDDELHFADWHVQQMLDVIDDPDCMEGDVDATSSDFTIERAAQIWHKCRLLIVRNLFDRSTIETYRQQVTQFMYDLNAGKVNPYGRTSYGEDFFIYDVDINRWDLILPSRLLPKDIVTNPIMINILKHELVLGENLSLLSNGIHMSEGGTREQEWHNDAPYAYGIDGTLRYHGAAGLEYPSTEITMFVPLLNITGQHGPTQFCMGSSALQGLELPQGSEKLLWYNETLKEEFFGNSLAMREGSGFMDDFCPSRMWRSTEVQFGDLVLWDYDLVHRAGYNNSTDFRSAIYGVFARTEHVKDTNFNNETVEEMNEFSDRSFHVGRFAMIPNYSQPVLLNDAHDSNILVNDIDIGTSEHSIATAPPPLTFANITSKFLSSTFCPSCHDLPSSSFCKSTERYRSSST